MSLSPHSHQKRHRRKAFPCADKKRHRSIQKAATAAASYNDRVVLKFGPMRRYQCDAHSCWHIGHANRMSARDVANHLSLHGRSETGQVSAMLTLRTCINCWTRYGPERGLA